MGPLSQQSIIATITLPLSHHWLLQSWSKIIVETRTVRVQMSPTADQHHTLDANFVQYLSTFVVSNVNVCNLLSLNCIHSRWNQFKLIYLNNQFSADMTVERLFST